MSNAYASLWTLTTAQLRDQVASIVSTPGGGSVSIVTAALGAALVQKGIAVSLKRSGSDSVRRQSLLALNSRISGLMASLSELADADSLAFQGYLKACALPRTTEGEKASHQAAREAALVHATQTPLEAAAQMGQGLEVAETAATLVDEHVRSEVIAGEMLLRASLKSVLLSVDANLPGIADSPVREALKLRRDELERTFTPS